jgi:hypothetical protein
MAISAMIIQFQPTIMPMRKRESGQRNNLFSIIYFYKNKINKFIVDSPTT